MLGMRTNLSFFGKPKLFLKIWVLGTLNIKRKVPKMHLKGACRHAELGVSLKN
jgi:hypothetical protein